MGAEAGRPRDPCHMAAAARKVLCCTMFGKVARRSLPAGLVLGLGLVGSCRETTRPSALTLRLAASSRLDSISVTDTSLVAESVLVTVSGSGAGTAGWTVTHGSAPWIALTRSAGTGTGYAVWQRDASWIGYGVSVDTIAVALSGTTAATLLDSVVTRELPAFVTMQRAWLPGERDSMVAEMRRDSLDGFYVPAAVADLLAASDSVTVVVPNPALAAAGKAAPPGMIGVAKLGQAGQSWIMVGYDLREVFPITPGSRTMDSLNLLGVLWYASPESTWKGRVVAATTKTTYKKTTVNTAAFDASYSKTGAGGGEARFGTGQYWEANKGQVNITRNSCSPTGCANSSFTSGPWLGGVWHGISVGGNLIQVVAPCLLPSGCTAKPDTFSVSFTNPRISGLAITCIFPSPCTGSAAAAIARIGRRMAARAAMRED
jgi:hypothetical protein